jgi:FKBP-type peptidyl-prolyl cis-trans isomerase
MPVRAACAVAVAGLLVAEGFVAPAQSFGRLNRHRVSGLQHQSCGCAQWRQSRSIARRRAVAAVQLAAESEAASATEQLEDISDGAGTCFKRVLQRGDGLKRYPTAGSKVEVHYSIHVAGTGAFVASSKPQPEVKDADSSAVQPPDEALAFDFYVGREPSEAMLGWDLALQTMEKGERALIICKPECAYGEAGAPPKIPPAATLECEIELLGWTNLREKYKPYSGRTQETRDERMARWEREIDEGTSPVQPDVPAQPQVPSAVHGRPTITEVRDEPEFKKKDRFVDLNDPEVRKATAKQVICGQGIGYTYMVKDHNTVLCVVLCVQL